MKQPPPPPHEPGSYRWSPEGFRIQLRQTADDGVELHHNAGRTLDVTLTPPEYPGRVDHQARTQAVASNTWTLLNFPPPEHEWVEITSLGGADREWTCTACPARLFERRTPDA